MLPDPRIGSHFMEGVVLSFDASTGFEGVCGLFTLCMGTGEPE